jgi:hypothetical protein
MYSFLKKHKKYISPAIAALILLITLVTFLLVPGIAQRKIIAGLASAGFNTSYIQKPQIAFGVILYKIVTFDEYDFSTVKYIKVTYNPFLFLMTGEFKDLDIIGLNLTGDWANTDIASLSFAGWSMPPDLEKIPLQAFHHISIKNARVSFLTKNAGGISVFFDIEATRKAGKTEFQANIKSEQKYLSIVGNANGVIDGARWYSDIEITDGKFEDPFGAARASRMSGWLNISSSPQEPLKIMSQMQTGGIALYDLPWQNASATLDYSNGNIKLFTEAKSIGPEGLELELNIFKKDLVPPAIAGTVHADKGLVFFDYLKDRFAYAGLLKNLSSFKKSPVNVDFLVEGKSVRYQIKDKKGQLKKAGEVVPTAP